MVCVVKDCGNEIHPERLAMHSAIITCSAACTQENDRELRRQGARRQRERNKKDAKR